MKKIKYYLLDFSKGCNGRWENAIYIPCGPCAHVCHLKSRGCLMTASPTGELILIAVNRYEELTGQLVVPERCAAVISKDAFERAFSRYLLWTLRSADQCALQQLEMKTGST